jgi:hypothetical protein
MNLELLSLRFSICRPRIRFDFAARGSDRESISAVHAGEIAGPRALAELLRQDEVAMLENNE